MRGPLPDSLDSVEANDVREWVLTEVESRITNGGALPPAVRYVGANWFDDADIKHVAELGGDPLLAAFFLQAARRSGVRAGYRMGEVTTSGERSAVVLEWQPGGAWWLASRPFGSDESGIGTFHGPWLIREGGADEDLPDFAESWLDPQSAEVASLSEEAREVVDDEPDIRAAIAHFDGEWPDGLAELCELIAIPLEAKALLAGMEFFQVLACRPGVLERWEVRGALPCTVADFVRAVAQQGPTIAVGVMHYGVVEHQGKNCKAILTTFERDGMRGSRALILDFSDGRPKPLMAHFAHRGPVAEDGWIGIEPTIDPGLRALGTMALGFGEVGEA